MDRLSFEEYHGGQLNSALQQADGQIYRLMTSEYQRQRDSLQLIAAENQCSQAVLAALGSVIQNKTTEGFPGARFHGGCEIVDRIEKLAVHRAKETFGAQYANVQPHCGTAANLIVITALLESGDRILSLGLDQGGHLSHGAAGAFTGKFFDVENYCVDKTTFLLDYDKIEEQALKTKPKLLICGATAYPRTIDFEKFRLIADKTGAYLLADISHISGLVIAGAHPSPVNYAHFTTTSTYKPGGPRGGLILMGKDYDRKVKTNGEDIALWELIEKTTFPGMQGTPYLNHIAGKAVFFKESLSSEYRQRQFAVVENAKALAYNLRKLGLDVLTGGTDNHMILINAAGLKDGLTGLTAQMCLEECGIVINRIPLPYETRDTSITSGIRLGTPIVTRNGMGTEEMETIAEMIDAVLRAVKPVNETEYEIDEALKNNIKAQVKDLCDRFPMR